MIEFPQVYSKMDIYIYIYEIVKLQHRFTDRHGNLNVIKSHISHYWIVLMKKVEYTNEDGKGHVIKYWKGQDDQYQVT